MFKIKKIVLSILLISIAIVLVLLKDINYQSISCMTPVQADDEKIILIDPGHGGIDGGAESKRGTIEKDINLSISLKLRDSLNKLGYTVLMTREEDKGLYTESGSMNKKKIEDLNNRCKIKRESNCDIFVSIHQNFFDESYYSGAQVWYSKNEDSGRLAHIIQQNFKKDLNNKNKRVEKLGNSYKVLRCYCSIPSVIVECGFLTNPQEERELMKDEYQDKIAESLSKSIEEYFQEVNKTRAIWKFKF
ncbi:N-acetylmuramoyl-L-alanine amidase CwlD [Clostridium magnum]|uniref:Germination-specific N-acetylmuramoyl-L-alanine amidase n=1 Tax=Clostridium magnum DSM 2767 TaxID=1121326 RepID=A0A162R556_9CLOT|nr:N-acetylmuramoyl-L-alanine amidase CwlD [Clostridium magnum]KZL89440.1 germination-specific N-acetylmuramoyl-L-alanine amidase precursor [Clostridium magnum DSM 2767]SHI20348.1 N-acetylmuramoyl-L-alanine amidase [Clostridium magnum DSM 2767]